MESMLSKLDMQIVPEYWHVTSLACVICVDFNT